MGGGCLGSQRKLDDLWYSRAVFTGRNVPQVAEPLLLAPSPLTWWLVDVVEDGDSEICPGSSKEPLVGSRVVQECSVK